jgi:hypothetical protein
MSNDKIRTRAFRAPVTKPVTESPVAKQDESTPDPPYVKREWKWKPLWQCTRCPFNSLDERGFWMHWAERHQPPQQAPSALVGPDGKPIEREE